MSVSKVSIANAALIKVGAERISSITQDCKRAIIINAIWDHVRDKVLRARKWNFAKMRVTLTPNGTSPDWGYDYQYDLPNDYLGFLETDPDDIQYVIENGKILTDEDELDVTYIYRNTDESSWDASFAEAMACLLAHEICYNLTQSSTLKDDLKDDYKKALADASFSNSVEKTIPPIESTSWTDARKR